ncbi:uncharacterized protein LOC111324500 [Stylophora pistillata]|uniref:uncharacterized protein LOC111324500 n=1 Tax=Stylophora pistillata TaxID=50429 RepID=UPI000C043501|nr:uncharacterized protein LOC111324500 [Stylophora pistillata]
MAFSVFPKESSICEMTVGILIVLISVVPDWVVSALCPDCTGQIKRINATGQCHSCFPCPVCFEGSTSSVQCGATVPSWTDIHCIEIQLHHQTSSQTSPAIFATTTNLVISATSSLVHGGSSISQSGESRSTKDPNTENTLPPLGSYSNWKRQTIVYILVGIALVILFLAIVFRFRKKSKGESQSAETTADDLTSVHHNPVHHSPVQPFPHQNHETCHIDFARRHAVYRCGHSSETVNKSSLDILPDLRDGTKSIPSGRGEVVAQLPGTPSCIDETPNFILGQMSSPMAFQQPQNQFLSPELWSQSHINFVRNCPVIMGVQSLTAVNWPVLTKKEKYKTKILEMPFQLLHDICLSLDIQRGDGKDKRLLAEKLGIKVPDLEVLQQALITKNMACPVTYVLLKERFSAVKPKGTVGDFVDILKEMEREDIVNKINGLNENKFQ